MEEKKNQIHFFSHTTFQWKSCGTSKILISEQHSILMNISYDLRTCIILTWARHSGCVPRIPALWRPPEEVYHEFENCMGTLAHMKRNCLKKKLKSKLKNKISTDECEAFDHQIAWELNCWLGTDQGGGGGPTDGGQTYLGGSQFLLAFIYVLLCMWVRMLQQISCGVHADGG